MSPNPFRLDCRAFCPMPILVLLCSLPGPMWAGDDGNVLHVNASAPPGGDGMTWQTAFHDLKDALAAAEYGDEIWVATGRYYPGGSDPERFVLRDGVELYGGFFGNETSVDQARPGTYDTVLDGRSTGSPPVPPPAREDAEVRIVYSPAFVPVGLPAVISVTAVNLTDQPIVLRRGQFGFTSKDAIEFLDFEFQLPLPPLAPIGSPSCAWGDTELPIVFWFILLNCDPPVDVPTVAPNSSLTIGELTVLLSDYGVVVETDPYGFTADLTSDSESFALNEFVAVDEPACIDPTYNECTGGLDNIVHASGVTAVLDGFTITNGCSVGPSEYDMGGGGLQVIDSNLVVRRCNFLGNQMRSDFLDGTYLGEHGGAIWIENSTVLFDQCSVFDSQSASQRFEGKHGGGIYAIDSDVTLMDCVFCNNRAGGGGSWDNVTYDGGSGGAIFKEGGPIMVVDSCWFQNNQAGRGGATNFPVKGGNGGNGGAISAVVDVQNSVFINNAAGNGGGDGGLAGCCAAGFGNFRNCLFVGNIRGTVAASMAENCIFRDNSPEYVLGANTQFSCAESGLADNGNIIGDPLLGDNYAPLPGSPCIDAGNPDSVFPPGAVDILGNPRVVCGRVDMGAIEVQTPQAPGDNDCDDDVDLIDVDALVRCVTGPGGAFVPGCQVFDFDGDGDVDFRDFGAMQRIAFAE